MCENTFMNKASWMSIYIFLFAFLMFMMGDALNSHETAPANIACTQYFIEFDGLTYDQIPYSSIDSIEFLKDYELVKVGKQEGIEFEEYYNGEADFKVIGKCHAYLYLTHPNYIVITAKDQKIIFNEPTVDTTYSMYKYIKHEMGVS